MGKRGFVLALETTSGGGSISVLEADREIGFWVGAGKVSKAAEFLFEIEKLFLKTEIKKKEIDLIKVSKGLGSFTGARIGWALAGGLERSLGCQVRGVSLLEALSVCTENLGDFFICVSNGGRQICLQTFVRFSPELVLAKNKPEILKLSDFINFLKNNPDQRFFLESVLFEKIILENFSGKKTHLKKISKNLARYIGMYDRKSSASDNESPLYLRDQINFGEVSETS